MANDSNAAATLPRTPEAMLALRRDGLRDPLRPRFHLTAPRGWLNDPNGLIQVGGRTHLFYQHNPHDAVWGPPSWGHVVSDDLVHWRDRPVALEPHAPPADDGGCWSGCAVDDDGTPTILYTGVKEGEQTTCLAFGDPALDVWRKFDGNPVQRTPTDAGITQKSFRDPYVWREEGGGWAMVIGVSIADRGDALLYRSADLRAWEPVGRLMDSAERDRWPDASHTWECTNFFPLGEKWVLLVSLATPEALSWPVAFVGDFDGRRFHPETQQRIDWGFHAFYAPLTLRDARGRRLIWGWLQEQRTTAAQRASGWSGAMSLPRDLTLVDGRVRTAFVPELQALRGESATATDLRIDGEHVLGGLGGHQLELRLTLERAGATRSGVRLEHAPGDSTRIAVDWEMGTLELDRGGSSADGALRWSGNAGRFARLGDRAELHLFLDRSVIELIADGELCLSARAYPEVLAEGAVALFSEGGATRVPRLEGWRLGSIWS